MNELDAQNQSDVFKGEWKPEPFEYEVCCMEGMDCYSGAYANKAGRAQIEKDLASARDNLVAAQEYYDEKNAIRLVKES